jgi:hypothetical protein
MKEMERIEVSPLCGHGVEHHRRCYECEAAPFGRVERAVDLGVEVDYEDLEPTVHVVLRLWGERRRTVVRDPDLVLAMWRDAEMQEGRVVVRPEGYEKPGVMYGTSPQWQAREYVRSVPPFPFARAALIRVHLRMGQRQRWDVAKVKLFGRALARALEARPLEIVPMRSLPGNMEIAEAVVSDVERLQMEGRLRRLVRG